MDTKVLKPFSQGFYIGFANIFSNENIVPETFQYIDEYTSQFV